MAGVADPVLFELVHDYLKVYLPKQRRCSPHTIRAYRTSLDQLFDYVKAQNMVTLSDITFDMLTGEMIRGFLDWLECSRGCSVSTRNHRLKCIRSFLGYAADMEATAVIHQNDMRKVPIKKSTSPDLINFMDQDGVFELLNQPDTKTRMGLRDQCFMILMYDAAARVQEMLDLCLGDIRFGKTPSATLTGKGSKVRTVPLMDITIRHIRQYLKVFHPDANAASDQPLFYVVSRGERHAMSDDNVRRFMKSYGEQARESCPHVHDTVHPHLLRHSRAMHLYQQGMELTLLSQWLGHAHLKTTLIYAHADTELKRKAIEKATASHDLLKNIPITARIDVDDDEVLKRLYGLK